jgi:hypothetical protein
MARKLKPIEIYIYLYYSLIIMSALIYVIISAHSFFSEAHKRHLVFCHAVPIVLILRVYRADGSPGMVQDDTNQSLPEVTAI